MTHGTDQPQAAPMSATIIELDSKRAGRIADTLADDHAHIRDNAISFADSLHDAMERFHLNPTMIATLLMAKAVDVLVESPGATSPDQEYQATNRLLKAIIEARNRARAQEPAVRLMNGTNDAVSEEECEVAKI